MTIKVMKIFPLVLVLFGLVFQPFGLHKAVLASDGDPADPAHYSNDWRPTGPPGGDVRDLVVDPGTETEVPARHYEAEALI